MSCVKERSEEQLRTRDPLLAHTLLMGASKWKSGPAEISSGWGTELRPAPVPSNEAGGMSTPPGPVAPELSREELLQQIVELYREFAEVKQCPAHYYSESTHPHLTCTTSSAFCRLTVSDFTGAGA